MRANSALRLNEFAGPVLGLIFLKFAGVKFSKTEKEIADDEPYLDLLYLSDEESKGWFYLTAAQAERTDIQSPWYCVVALVE